MRRIVKSLCSMLAVVGLLFTTGGVAAAAPVSDGPSTAAVSCSGHVTYSETRPNIGRLVIYYNSSNGGTNSACMYHNGSNYGVAAPTDVQIWRCTQSSGEGQPCTADKASPKDSGNFLYYAGPVGVTGTANRCVRALGHVAVGPRNYIFDSKRQGC
ncbi:hypothetical protein FHR81_001660 [Actinoalloteichus hoggarensis]|uniref:Uncharacterized protein n=1 Tax=Actinoalloteichus hoggarensis TaxID=1470176 RepID=A0A221W0X7_9PSEU|nr:hypothetical protein [Actinoalloteichus hoggarensis]ASO19393.1 hypothetical protein AHOG_08745 [Actinoalloteichus hoggarensis]MBB5920630.1 hypothetical protein [Actinoalloteichus hoggarensis]